MYIVRSLLCKHFQRKETKEKYSHVTKPTVDFLQFQNYNTI